MTKIKSLPAVLQEKAINQRDIHERKMNCKVAYPDTIKGAFLWHNTPQGNSFWEAVNNMDWTKGHYLPLSQLKAMFPHIDIGYEFGTPDAPDIPKDKVYLLHRTKYVTISQHR